MSLNSGLSNCFLIVRMRLYILTISQQRCVSFWMHNTKRFMFLYLITTGDVNHDHLAKVVSIMFLHFKVTIFTLEVIF